MLKRFAVLALFALAACGSPEVGDDCSQEGALTCNSSTEVLSCEGGKVRAASCRGPAGCVENATQTVCDVSRAQAGDGCLKSQESTAQCMNGDANRGLVCTSGTWTARTCNACAVQGGQVVCAP
ncbi:hypothetical protein [Archangium sp.]|uniref:hypothetical protein n=1 Tax=Archangium sp. TaxID=1872627 RepID=UPI00286B9A42|nr:hypothetical protein [Archangium sp.]